MNMMAGFLSGLMIAANGLGTTPARARALAVAAVGLVSLIIGGVALARRSGRSAGMVALILGVIGVILSVVHLGGSTGFGTGGGRAGAIVALVLSLIGAILGWLARARSNKATQ